MSPHSVNAALSNISSTRWFRGFSTWVQATSRAAPYFVGLTLGILGLCLMKLGAGIKRAGESLTAWSEDARPKL